MQATKTPDGMVSLQSIYDVICTRYQNKKEDSYDGLLRLLRKKYAFLQKHLLMCNKEEFKVKGNNFVPVNDAPIVRDLLLEALSTEESNPTRDWFLGKVDTSVSEQALVLYMHMKCVIKNSYLLGETDQVTCDEWLNTVSASINHNTARNTLDLKRSLERFRNDSLALDMNVAVGDITASDEFGNRAYILKGQRSAPISQEKPSRRYWSVFNLKMIISPYWRKSWLDLKSTPKSASWKTSNSMLKQRVPLI